MLTHNGTLLTVFVPHGSLSLLSHSTQDSCSGMEPPTVSWALHLSISNEANGPYLEANLTEATPQLRVPSFWVFQAN